LLNVVIHRANCQDRDGTRRLLRDARRRFPSIVKLFADAGYQGPRVAQVVADIGTVAALVRLAMIRIMLRRLTRLNPCP
jgi:hypothetical protein